MKKIIEIKGKKVYPFSRENFDAIINYYFITNGITKEGPKTLDEVFNDVSQIELFEFEYIVNCIVHNLPIFIDGTSIRILTISNLCKYGLDAFLDTPNPGSANRIRITKLFAEALKKDCK